MEFSVRRISNLRKQRSACIIIGVFEPCCLSSIAKQLDRISGGYISDLLNHGELEGKTGQKLLVYHIPNVPFERVLLIGCGNQYSFDERKYRQVIYTMINALNCTGSIDAICFLTELNVEKRNTYWKVRQAVEIVKESLYIFNHLKSNKTDLHRPLRKIVFNVRTSNELTKGKYAIQHGLAIADSIKVAKDLSNMPPNICNPAYLALHACQMAECYSKTTKTKVINEQQMKEIGMNAYLAVGQGSLNESLMSIIEYKGNPDHKTRPIVLVGKGVTFDAGGISIKSADNMDEMKYDMCGAAAVYGIMHMAIQLNLPLNIIGVLAGCENILDGNSFRPGDILTTLSGQTVEVLNTDAEGRLILCDALTYVERLNPEVVIDIATLTGACIIALGHHLTGLMSNNDQLADELLSASEQASDRAWCLPLTDEFQEQLESNFADVANVGGRPGSVITAGCFLSRFAQKYNWAHLDIAGTAWQSGKIRSATGRPIAMLSQFLLNRSKLNYNK